MTCPQLAPGTLLPIAVAGYTARIVCIPIELLTQSAVP